MTGPTASIAVTAPLPGIAALPSFLTVGAPVSATVAAPGAAPSLATFVDLMIGKAVTPQPKPPVRGLQDDAVPGKSLPDDEQDDAGSALAWLFAAPPIAQPDVAAQPEPPAPVEFVVNIVAPDPTIGPVAPAPIEPGQDAPVAAKPSPAVSTPVVGPVATPDIIIGPIEPNPVAQPVAVQIEIRAIPVATLRAPALPASVAVAVPQPVAPPIAGPVPQPAAAPIAQPVTAPVIAPVVIAPEPIVAPAEPALRAAAAVVTPIKVAPAPVPAPTVGIAAPAIQTVPAAIAQIIAGGAAQPALFALAAGRGRSTDDEARPPISAAASAALLLQPTDAAALIAKPGGAQGQALDMGRQDWPNKMIDHIEALRDNADATNTSISLKPDALGRIDIAVRAHGAGAVSVHFTADQPTTRTLLADAQPQLQAAAEARGIKLTGASVDLSGSHDHADRGQPRFEPKPTSNNRLAASAEDSDAASDGRVA